MEQQTTQEILDRITELQNIQKTHRTTDPAWQTASELLQPLFAEMARRQNAEHENAG